MHKIMVIGSNSFSGASFVDFALDKKAELRLTISDLLNQTQYFYQNTNDKKTFQKDTDAYRFTRKAGSTYSITFNYSL